VRLKDKFAIKPASVQPTYTLNVDCFDARYNLNSLHVIVNDNPLFGVTGKKLDQKSNRASESVIIPLGTGVNMIKVYCTNSNGNSSLAEYIEINGNHTLQHQPVTYFIGIAVSGYKDSSMNLRFAAKDVRDLSESFRTMFKEQLVIDTLIDEKATRENILALRQRLMNTTINDKVIISVNGHGLLDQQLDFYYATHDMDFKNPGSKGLKYEGCLPFRCFG
jgi:hypothetical protein